MARRLLRKDAGFACTRRAREEREEDFRQHSTDVREQVRNLRQQENEADDRPRREPKHASRPCDGQEAAPRSSHASRHRGRPFPAAYAPSRARHPSAPRFGEAGRSRGRGTIREYVGGVETDEDEDEDEDEDDDDDEVEDGEANQRQGSYEDDGLQQSITEAEASDSPAGRVGMPPRTNSRAVTSPERRSFINREATYIAGIEELLNDQDDNGVERSESREDARGESLEFHRFREPSVRRGSAGNPIDLSDEDGVEEEAERRPPVEFWPAEQVGVTIEYGDLPSLPTLQNALEAVPEVVVKKKRSTHSAGNRETLNFEGDCAICMEDFKEDETLKKFACTHVMHRGCALQLLLNKTICPFCRRPLIEQEALDEVLEEREMFIRNIDLLRKSQVETSQVIEDELGEVAAADEAQANAEVWDAKANRLEQEADFVQAEVARLKQKDHDIRADAGRVWRKEMRKADRVLQQAGDKQTEEDRLRQEVKDARAKSAQYERENTDHLQEAGGARLKKKTLIRRSQMVMGVRDE